MDKGRYFGIIDVVHLDVRKLESLDIDLLRTRLQSLGYHGEPFLNVFGFCPHIIAAIDDDGRLFVDNTNSGNYALHTRQHHVIECTTTDEFIQQVASLCGKSGGENGRSGVHERHGGSTSSLTKKGTLF